MTETLTQALHRLTSFPAEPDWDDPIDVGADPRLARFAILDPERVPWPYKRYERDLPRRELPADLPPSTAPTLSVLAGSANVAGAELDVAELARTLFLSAGVVRTAEWQMGHDGKLLFRAAGSAGGRFPLEIYAAVPEGTSAPAGVHWYDPEQHALVEIAAPPEAVAPALVVTGVPWRTGWKYRERGFRHVYWDAGTMLAQTLAAAASAGLAPQLITRFPDGTVESLVGADGVHEFAVAVVSLGAASPALRPTSEAVRGAVDRAPLEFPLVTAAQSAGDLDAWGEPWLTGDVVAVGGEGEPVEEVVLRRSSQRRMDRTRGLPRDVLVTSMRVAMRGIDVPHWVAVHDVGGFVPGLYRWPDLTTPVRAGALRRELYHVGADQGLARDAAFVVVSATKTAELDDRAYRDAQLAAGIVAGRLHLAAYAQDATASGLTFLDPAIAELVGEPIDGLLLTCVGLADNTSKPGGRPRSPVEFTPVRTRSDDE